MEVTVKSKIVQTLLACAMLLLATTVMAGLSW